MRQANPVTADKDLARRVAQRDAGALESVMRLQNGRLFRVARSILRNPADAEDAVQEAYVAAFTKIDTFRGDAQLATWLTRIVINKALARRRRQYGERTVVALTDPQHRVPEPEESAVAYQPVESPEQGAMREQMRRVLEQKIDELPMDFRTVLVLRDVEELTTEETAACLGISNATVRTRLFRARALLRAALAQEVDVATTDVFNFAGERCDRIVARVLERMREVAAEPTVRRDA